MNAYYQSQIWAYQLYLRGSGGDVSALSRSISNARVDLNPHQVDAALFSLRSPFANGVILADEVGLGKTIEAGLVITQKWAERKRRVLIVVPAMLRNQWRQELLDKFFISSVILDSKVFNRLKKDGALNPFDLRDEVAVCSYNFAAAKEAEIAQIPWDLVVFDEAHRLRNLYQSFERSKKSASAKKSIARRIVEATSAAPKLLLTATPLQNSLLELYSLISVVDPHIFGDLNSFRAQFANAQDETRRNVLLKERIAGVCSRTLRKQVAEYVPFTRRAPITQDFFPTEKEQELYDKITEYLQRETLYALPASQRQLITIVLRKLLASSTFAIARTLKNLAERLENVGRELQLFDDEDLDGFDSFEDEFCADDESNAGKLNAQYDPEAFKQELNDLQSFAELAASVARNAKGDALIEALQTAFNKTDEIGAARKAVIFTESRQTQNYLVKLLSANGYDGQVVSISGSNDAPGQQKIYERWLEKHADDDRVAGSKAVDMKAALVDYFRESATILVSTEAAAEGVNLQFCSLIVNYDLPWNPQRIEQRIGRCHRYGQKHDVVVVNFINRRNEADRRVYELLSQKFRLFDGVLGASDEILGALESGVDIEKRIAFVYQNCRAPEEIERAFDELQKELDDKIQARLKSTRRLLMENFDEEVRLRLRLSQEKTNDCLSRQEKTLLNLTKAELGDDARFDPELPRFEYLGSDAPRGWYDFDWKKADENNEFFYRSDCSLARKLIASALERKLPLASLTFSLSNYRAKLSLIEPFRGRSGWLEASLLTIRSVSKDEFLVFAARTDDGQTLDDEICQKLFWLPATQDAQLDAEPPADLSEIRQVEIARRVEEVDERNLRFLEEESFKLDRWSDDLKLSLEQELIELDKLIAEKRREATSTRGLQEKIAAQKQVRELERRRNQKRRELYAAQDAVEQKRDELIERLEEQTKEKIEEKRLFTIRWSVV
ncbi:MAG: DEAD/DEAH box helicase family protein [Thermoguttaceae bacterium]|nr:DEAD/DEAH box helicase family protein [Thermoguttaceae bacterium]